jgi:hypothetical protein
MPANPFVNGNSYSFVQIETIVGFLPVAGIKDISYDDDLKRAPVYGTGSVQIGLTRGTYTAKGSIEFHKNAFLIGVLTQFGPGWRQQQTFLNVSYGPNDNGLIQNDVFPAVLFGSAESSNSQSDDGTPLTNKIGLYIPVPILWNGVPSIVETFPLIAVA